MEISVEIGTIFLNVGLGIVCLALIQIFKDSLFADIAKFLFILAISMIAHSAVMVFLSGEYSVFIYGVSAVIVSVSYLLLISAILTALSKINEKNPA